MKIFSWRLLFVFTVGLLFHFKLHAQNTYDSLVDAIDTAQAQAYVDLKKGVYETSTGDNDIAWEIKSDQKIKVKFFYGGGTLQNGVVDFGTNATFAKVRNTKDGVCIRFRILRLVVGPGGFINDSESDILMDPDGDCTTQNSIYQASIHRIFQPNKNANKFFRGEVFAGIFCNKNVQPCAQGALQTKNQSPISNVRFFTTTDSSGVPTNEAFLVRLKSDQAIAFPGGNFVTLGGGSQVSFGDIEYNVTSNSGDADLKDFSINAKNGSLVFGGTNLNIASGTSIKFAGLNIVKNNETVQIRGGSISGTIGDGSIVQLDATGGRESLIAVQSARLQLNNLDINFSKTGNIFSGETGFFEITTKASRLALSNEMLLLVQSSNLRLNLGCPSGAPIACRGFKWSSDGTVLVKGTIAGAAIHLAQGGFVTLPGQNKLNIESGEMLTNVLTVDTENKKTPITGKLQNISLKLAAQDWRFDKTTSLKAAEFSLNSQELAIQKDDEFPIGEVKFKASVTDLNAKGLGNIRFASASGNADIIVRRDTGDDPKIEGSIGGYLIVSASELNSNATASIRIHSIKYYRGYGTAKLDFSIDSATAQYLTPTIKPDPEEGIPGGRFVITSSQVPLQISLLAPISFNNVEVTVDQGNWLAQDILGLPIKVKFTTPTSPVVSARLQLGQNHNYIDTSCHPEVKVLAGSYQISGLVDLKFGKLPRTITTKNFSIDRTIEADFDSSDCKTWAAAICAIAASPLGPIGSTAAALACGNEVDKQKEKFQKDVVDKTYEFIQSLNFTSAL
jgi:hypothetical protein